MEREASIAEADGGPGLGGIITGLGGMDGMGHDSEGVKMRTFDNLSPNLPEPYDLKDLNCCPALSICGPVCPLKMLPSNNKNSSTI